MKLSIVALPALVLAALTGCGGGDPEDGRRTTEPVHCNQPGANHVCAAARINLRATLIGVWK